MIRGPIAITALLLSAACNVTSPSDERQAALQAAVTAEQAAEEGDVVFNISGNPITVSPENLVPANPANYTPPFEVLVTEPRARALVRPINARATIGQIEGAARTRTGCAATAEPQIYAFVRNNRTNVLLTTDQLRSVDWRVPVTLNCG